MSDFIVDILLMMKLKKLMNDIIVGDVVGD